MATSFAPVAAPPRQQPPRLRRHLRPTRRPRWRGHESSPCRRALRPPVHRALQHRHRLQGQQGQQGQQGCIQRQPCLDPRRLSQCAHLSPPVGQVRSCYTRFCARLVCLDASLLNRARCSFVGHGGLDGPGWDGCGDAESQDVCGRGTAGAGATRTVLPGTAAKAARHPPLLCPCWPVECSCAVRSARMWRVQLS